MLMDVYLCKCLTSHGKAGMFNTVLVSWTSWTDQNSTVCCRSGGKCCKNCWRGCRALWPVLLSIAFPTILATSTNIVICLAALLYSGLQPLYLQKPLGNCMFCYLLMLWLAWLHYLESICSLDPHSMMMTWLQVWSLLVETFMCNQRY